ncbi:MAG: DUF1553 domain-containing protein [Pirellulaceae bacterium]
MQRRSCLSSGQLTAFGLLILILCGPALSDERPKISFSKEILPLLSDRCFTCHGPDAERRESELRLDDMSSALDLAIVPGEPDTSPLIERIFSEDADTVMPPRDSNLKLDEREKAALRQWIAEGAKYEKHWAFNPPIIPALPDVVDLQWARNEIDRFVLHTLESRQLSPSVEADRETLIRRVTLDLTGLPPTIGEIDAFVANEAPAAYEQLVDRLLASPSYGERMTVDWLDAARYADTHGYQNDRYRAMWPWRDWVVSSFNDNMPYDQFITWQLAGDLLPQPTQSQILATAFNRHHRQTNEGGSVEEEFRAEYVADRVNTFGAAFLGLTLECCRCHDHKYDPITQRDYYALSAFFNSIDESGLYSHFTDDTPTPTLVLTAEEQQSQLERLAVQIQAKQSELQGLCPSPEQFAEWRASLRDVRPSEAVAAPPTVSLKESLAQSLKLGLVADYSFDEMPDGKLINRITGEADGKTSESPTLVAAKVGQGLKLSGENNATFAAGGGFTRDQPFTISLWIKTPTRFERSVIFHRSRAWTDAASRGYELLIEDGRLSAALIHFWPGDAMRIVATDELPLDTWTHVTMAYDGSSQAAGLKLFVDGNAADVEIVRDKLTQQIHGGEANELAIGQRFRDVGFKDGTVDELKVYERALLPLEIMTLYLRDAAPANVAEYLHNASDDLLIAYCAEQLPDLKHQRDALRQNLAELRKRRSGLLDPIPEVMVMREEPQPRPTFILTRGAYDAPGAVVKRGVPESIFPFEPHPQHATPDRRDLANWLTHAEHPLTARVAVNRFWAALFGRGIVSTNEDFGLQGDSPAHPELLDWLARQFIDSGWNVKQLMKTIVMSATYRQQSNPTSRLLALDPENTLLARGPTARLPAEMIRDSALAASGLLVDKLGGPPVKPYQPPGLWEEKSGETYRRDEGEGSRRRSLYTYWKRTSPPPAMMTFDASNREVCIVGRQVTMTPLQVLVLLNDPQMVEAAIALGERAMHDSNETSQELQFIFRSLVGRAATSREMSLLVQIFEEQREWFAQDSEATQRFLTTGDHRVAEGLDASSLAALATVAQGLMSFDEFVMKR